MKLHILGCGDAFGSGGRNQTGYLIDADYLQFLLDCGPTTLLAMKRAGLDSSKLDAVFLSHLHGDHFGGLPFLFLEFLYRSQRDRPLHIAGPAGSEARVDELFRTMYGGAGSSNIPPFAHFHILPPDRSVTIAGIQIYSFRVPHQTDGNSLALKVTYQNKRLLFSGDSEWTDRFIEQAPGVDLFLCECSFYAQASGNHMNFLQLQEQMPRLSCRRLILTHLGDEMIERGKELPVTLAQDGMVIEI